MSSPQKCFQQKNKTDEDGWGGPRIVSVCMIYACVLMDFLRFFSRLTCKLVKVLVELVPVPVLGDVAHEEPVVVVRDGHAHLPAFADLTTIELSWTDTRTHTHITTKNKLIKKSARNFTAFSSVHPPIWIIKKKKYYKKRKKKWIANLHSNSHSSMIHSFTGYSVICARAFKKSTKRKKPEKGRGKRKRLTRNLPTEQKTNPAAVSQRWPSLFLWPPVWTKTNRPTELSQ